jgi:hypothetical protein
LDEQARLYRLIWAESFWLFWKSVAAVPSSKIQSALMYMDEKYFYAIKARTNCKVLTSIGLDACQEYDTHHKNHIQKELCIVVTAYMLGPDNNITKGGKAYQIACVQVGSMVKAKKDSYKRVYNNDRTFHYPVIESNKLWFAGNFFLVSLWAAVGVLTQIQKCHFLKYTKISLYLP